MNDECYMCSAIASSREHVPPRCIFPELKDSNGTNFRKELITVPSCELHNLKKSNDDEYLFHALSASITSNSIALNQLSGKVKRAFIKNSTKFQKFFELNELVTLERLEDNTIENGMLVGIEGNRLDCILAQCARGLFFHETGRKILGLSRVVTFFTMYTDSVQQKKVEEVYIHAKNHFSNLPEKGKNPEIFKYKLYESDSDVMVFMVFYETSEALVRVIK